MLVLNTPVYVPFLLAMLGACTVQSILHSVIWACYVCPQLYSIVTRTGRNMRQEKVLVKDKNTTSLLVGLNWLCLETCSIKSVEYKDPTRTTDRKQSRELPTESFRLLPSTRRSPRRWASPQGLMYIARDPLKSPGIDRMSPPAVNQPNPRPSPGRRLANLAGDISKPPQSGGISPHLTRPTTKKEVGPSASALSYHSFHRQLPLHASPDAKEVGSTWSFRSWCPLRLPSL